MIIRETLKKIIRKINMNEKLGDFRGQIDEVDLEIIRLLEKRAEIAGKIGEIKRENNMPIRDEEREKEVVEKLGGKSSLNPEFIEKLYAEIIRYCRENE